MRFIGIAFAGRHCGSAFDALLENWHAASNRDGYFLLEGHGVPREVS